MQFAYRRFISIFLAKKAENSCIDYTSVCVRIVAVRIVAVRILAVRIVAVRIVAVRPLFTYFDRFSRKLV
jgi:hypothetical protein